jgi:hypothetical protein
VERNFNCVRVKEIQDERLHPLPGLPGNYVCLVRCPANIAKVWPVERGITRDLVEEAPVILPLASAGQRAALYRLFFGTASVLRERGAVRTRIITSPQTRNNLGATPFEFAGRIHANHPETLL